MELFFSRLVIVLIINAIATLIIYAIRNIEDINKIKKIFKEERNLTSTSIIIKSIVITTLFVCAIKLNYDKNEFNIINIIFFLINFFLAFYVSSEASKQNRSKIIWFFMGLFSFVGAMIILDYSKIIFTKKSSKLKDTLEFLNKETQSKIDALNNYKLPEIKKIKKGSKGITTLKLSEALDDYNTRLNAIKTEYNTNFDSIYTKETKEDEMKIKLKNYEQALDKGVITQDEFNKKTEGFIKEDRDIEKLEKKSTLKEKYKNLILKILQRSPNYKLTEIDVNNIEINDFLGMKLNFKKINNKLEIIWNWERISGKNHTVEWSFNEDENQNSMYQTIDRDMKIQNFIDDGMNKEQATHWYQMSITEDEEEQNQLAMEFQKKYPVLWSKIIG